MKSPALKFVFAGFLNTIISYTVFLAIFGTTGSAFLALVLASAFGTYSSFLLNRFWVWGTRKPSSLSRFIQFQGFLIVVNWLVLHFVSLTNFPREIAQGIIYLSVALLTFFVNKRFIF